MCGFEIPTFQKIVCKLGFCRFLLLYSKCMRRNPGFDANEDSQNLVINNKSSVCAAGVARIAF